MCIRSIPRDFNHASLTKITKALSTGKKPVQFVSERIETHARVKRFVSRGEKRVNENNVDWLMISDCLIKIVFELNMKAMIITNRYALLICSEFCQEG